MGLDKTSLEAVIISLKNVNVTRGDVLTLARQCIHIDRYTFDQLFLSHGISLSNNAYFSYCEPMFKELGFNNVDSIDCSSYENATIIHDMNERIPTFCGLAGMKKYDYIFDGGTIEHIFNIPRYAKIL